MTSERGNPEQVDPDPNKEYPPFPSRLSIQSRLISSCYILGQG